jgi:hypothetical protein
MSKNSPNSPKVNWILILTIIGTVIAGGGVIATLVTVPEFRCLLLGWSCSPPFRDVELVTKNEAGELLSGVEITAIGSGGPPEKTQTESNGYAKITIANKGNVNVTLRKSGYPVQEFTINLQNEQYLVRIIRFNPSGKPEVIASATLPSPPPSPSPTPSPSPSPSPPLSSSPSPSDIVKMDGNVTWEFKKCVRKQATASCSFVLTTTGERINYNLDLGNTKMTDRRGHEYFVDKATFADINSNISNTRSLQHEMQNGAMYDVNIDFGKIPSSISEVNSLIVGVYSNNSAIKFDNIFIK